jgi:hypothetical protein
MRGRRADRRSLDTYDRRKLPDELSLEAETDELLYLLDVEEAAERFELLEMR